MKALSCVSSISPISEALPAIQGSFNGRPNKSSGNYGVVWTDSNNPGAFKSTLGGGYSSSSVDIQSGTQRENDIMNFNASNSNPIYSGTTVTPLSYSCNFLIKFC